MAEPAQSSDMGCTPSDDGNRVDEDLGDLDDVSDSSDCDATPPRAGEARGKATAGRKASFIWNYFDKVAGTHDGKKKRWDVLCKLCPDRKQRHRIISARPKSMLNHLAVCHGVTTEVRAVLRDNAMHTGGGVLANDGPGRKALRTSDSKRKQSTMSEHVSFLQKLDQTTRRRVNTKLVEFVASNNIAFSAINSQSFLDFCQLLCKDYVPPGAMPPLLTIWCTAGSGCWNRRIAWGRPARRSCV